MADGVVDERSDGLLQAFVLNGEGGGRPCSWTDLRTWSPTDGTLWVHLDTESGTARDWLRESADLDEVACDSLLADGTRPRCTPHEEGLLVILRGVNLNPGADPEDMVALRLWGDSARVVTLSRRRLMAVPDLAIEIRNGMGPTCPAELVVSLATHLLERMAPTLDDIEDAVDGLEDRAFEDATGQLQGELAELRRQIIGLRRHLAPQREAMFRLAQAGADFIGDEARGSLQLLADQVTRYVEGLEELRDRATVSHDLLVSRQADALNKRMLFLAIVTAVFLPLGLIAGVLGINVAGIPGATSESAFAFVCAIVLFVGVLEVWALKRMKWW